MPQSIPQHVAVIMDGNGRWAKARFMPRIEGHRRGMQALRRLTEAARRMGVKHLTVFAFSSENWKRPAEEVGAIMRLFGEYLIKGFDYKNRNIRICFMGDRTVLDEKLQQLMNKLEAESSVKTGMTLNIAINYGGRPEIVRAAQQLAAKAAAGEIRPDFLTHFRFMGTNTGRVYATQSSIWAMMASGAAPLRAIRAASTTAIP